LWSWIPSITGRISEANAAVEIVRSQLKAAVEQVSCITETVSG